MQALELQTLCACILTRGHPGPRGLGTVTLDIGATNAKMYKLISINDLGTLLNEGPPIQV